jgi:trans-2,3-dihydro-3-hydroxyanthranilate isomerase
VTGPRFFICDVFTETRFGGNPLLVVPDARGLTDDQMQRLAREINFAESTFVLPAERGHTRRVRIFTPVREVPFAGHPNVGTAFVLAASGELGDIGEATTVTFEEKAGLVPVVIRRRGIGLFCELTAPEPLSLGSPIPARLVAEAISIDPAEVVASHHPPRVASVGLPFVIAELRDRAALERARVRPDGFDAIAALGVVPDLHLYVRSGDGFDLRTRMFAPHDGVPEDPATGSANAALAGLLASLEPGDGPLRFRIAQGVEMGRPSVLEATVERHAGIPPSIRIGGASVMVAEGRWILDPETP